MYTCNVTYTYKRRKSILYRSIYSKSPVIEWGPNNNWLSHKNKPSIKEEKESFLSYYVFFCSFATLFVIPYIYDKSMSVSGWHKV